MRSRDAVIAVLFLTCCFATDTVAEAASTNRPLLDYINKTTDIDPAVVSKLRGKFPPEPFLIHKVTSHAITFDSAKSPTHPKKFSSLPKQGKILSVKSLAKHSAVKPKSTSKKHAR